MVAGARNQHYLQLWRQHLRFFSEILASQSLLRSNDLAAVGSGSPVWGAGRDNFRDDSFTESANEFTHARRQTHSLASPAGSRCLCSARAGHPAAVVLVHDAYSRPGISSVAADGKVWRISGKVDASGQADVSANVLRAGTTLVFAVAGTDAPVVTGR